MIPIVAVIASTIAVLLCLATTSLGSPADI
jgi:hypothetical protein